MMNPPVPTSPGRRILRTAIQLIAGLSVVTVTQLLGAHIPAAYLPVAISVITLAITAAQNLAEQNGWVPILLPNAHPDPIDRVGAAAAK
jgi:hypothetical protein